MCQPHSHPYTAETPAFFAFEAAVKGLSVHAVKAVHRLTSGKTSYIEKEKKKRNHPKVDASKLVYSKSRWCSNVCVSD